MNYRTIKCLWPQSRDHSFLLCLKSSKQVSELLVIFNIHVILNSVQSIHSHLYWIKFKKNKVSLELKKNMFCFIEKYSVSVITSVDTRSSIMVSIKHFCLIRLTQWPLIGQYSPLLASDWSQVTPWVRAGDYCFTITISRHEPSPNNGLDWKLSPIDRKWGWEVRHEPITVQDGSQ